MPGTKNYMIQRAIAISTNIPFNISFKKYPCLIENEF